MKEPPQEEDTESPSPRLVLSGTSPIQVKFIGWLVIVCAGGFGGWIWWASSMSTKLDVVIANQSTQLSMLKEVNADVSALKEWRIQVDTVGSQPMARRVAQLEKEVAAIAKDMEMHKVTTDRKSP